MEAGWCSIRVNKQYRLIFRREDGTAEDTYLVVHAVNSVTFRASVLRSLELATASPALARLAHDACVTAES
ncbi:type II toxin-antitoxin system RelE/ParE family toxin, partial [Marinimicrobium sp. UBA4509]|uniref:type II toxin-antitoxin system RelE/ParE family toxin n=1 Tax=Marinimicrobium sp. UBA4509 TaxID=1946811 RepID=UPI0039C9677B